MRPISIEFQAFGPYSGHEFVDFTDLKSKGLFLICGETGSGKTMVLDAMCMALYGVGSGGARDDISELRCNKCDDSVDTFVSFIFEQDGHIYKFERRVSKKVKNLKISRDVYMLDENGVYAPFLPNCTKNDINKKAEEIVGLNAEQFRQVVILPQGQFETFLTSKTEDKEKILDKLFDAGKWEKIAKNFYVRAEAAKKQLDDDAKYVINVLAEHGCKSFEEINIRIDAENSILKEIKESFEKEHIKEREELLEAKKLTKQEFIKLRGVELEYEALCAKDEEISFNSSRARLGSLAEAFKEPVKKTEELRTDYTKRQAEATKNTEAYENAKNELSAAEDKLVQHEEEKPEYEKWDAQIRNLLTLKPFYENISSIENELRSKEVVYSAQKRKVEQLLADRNLADKTLSTKNEEYNAAAQNAYAVRQAYMKNIGGVLAAELKLNEPCPVCGSLNHPSPAKLSDDSASKEDVDMAQKKEEKLKAEWDLAREKREAAVLSATRANEDLQKIESERMVLSSKLNEAREKQIDNIKSLEELEANIHVLEKKRQNYENTSKLLTDNLNARKLGLEKLKSAKDISEQEKKLAYEKAVKASEQLKTLLESSPFENMDAAKKAMLDSKQVEEINALVTKHKTLKEEKIKLISELKEKLKDATELQNNDINAEKQAIEQLKENYQNNLGRKQKEIEALEHVRMRIEAKNQEIEARRNIVESNYSFAKQLRGDSGIGLKRYVLAIMFSNVIQAANKMLEKVHNGRYRLKRTDEKVTGNKRGLEFKVIDRNARAKEGKDGSVLVAERNVATLSGGEKFLVSLSLAIGMSTVAQRSGVKIEAMFIDEGFGTLDQNSINDALEVLNSIRKANGMVGIISHVDLLKAHIMSKLIINQDEKGSSISLSIG